MIGSKMIRTPQQGSMFAFKIDIRPAVIRRHTQKGLKVVSTRLKSYSAGDYESGASEKRKRKGETAFVCLLYE